MSPQPPPNSIASAIPSKIPGMHLLATNASRTFTYTCTPGSRTLPSTSITPLLPTDIVYLASATKLLTTLTALALVDDGVLSLHHPVSKLVPELDAKQVLTGWTDNDEPIYEAQKTPITLAMLLTHSAGLNYHFLDPKLAKWHAKYGTSTQPSNKGKRFPVEELYNYPLSYQPGEAWMYGVGLDWAGKVIERATGKTLGAVLQERILDRIGVPASDFSFFPLQTEEMRARCCDVSDEDDGLGLATGAGDANKVSSGDFGGHGGFMAADSYLAVLRMLLVNDGSVLKQSTVDSMFSQQLSGSAAEAHVKALDGPVGWAFRVGTKGGSKAGHGYGGLVTMEGQEWCGEGTLSWGGGMTVAWFVDRGNDVAAFGTVRARLPVDVPLMEEMKGEFRREVRRAKEEWAKGGKGAVL